MKKQLRGQYTIAIPESQDRLEHPIETNRTSILSPSVEHLQYSNVEMHLPQRAAYGADRHLKLGQLLKAAYTGSHTEQILQILRR